MDTRGDGNKLLHVQPKPLIVDVGDFYCKTTTATKKRSSYQGKNLDAKSTVECIHLMFRMIGAFTVLAALFFLLF
jgi:hypothetical protein